MPALKYRRAATGAPDARSKYGRPARAVTVTLPEDVLARLTAVHADVGSAIVNLVERSAPVRAEPIRAAEVTRYGNRAVIIVTPSPTLRRLRGVQLVPVGNGRALISLSAATSISSLELQVRDALERLGPENREREGLQLLADILRRSRGSRELAPRRLAPSSCSHRRPSGGSVDRPALARDDQRLSHPVRHLPVRDPKPPARCARRRAPARRCRAWPLQHVSEREALEMRANARRPRSRHLRGAFESSCG